jgi:hypothetical protein
MTDIRQLMCSCAFFLYSYTADLLLRNVLLSFVKEELIKGKEGMQLLSISFELQNNQKNNMNIDIGETTRIHIKDLSTNEKVVFFQDVRQIYCNITVSN